MGQVGTSADNAAMDSFFSLLQNNVLNRHRWDSRQQLHTAIVSWIERTYHRRRRQARLGRLTPVEFETIMTPAADLAAQAAVTKPCTSPTGCACTEQLRSRRTMRFEVFRYRRFL